MTRLLTIEEVQELLGVGRDWIYTRIKNGRLKSHKLGKYRRFRSSDLESYILGKTEPNRVDEKEQAL